MAYWLWSGQSNHAFLSVQKARIQQLFQPQGRISQLVFSQIQSLEEVGSNTSEETPQAGQNLHIPFPFVPFMPLKPALCRQHCQVVLPAWIDWMAALNRSSASFCLHLPSRNRKLLELFLSQAGSLTGWSLSLRTTFPLSQCRSGLSLMALISLPIAASPPPRPGL